LIDAPAAAGVVTRQAHHRNRRIVAAPTLAQARVRLDARYSPHPEWQARTWVAGPVAPGERAASPPAPSAARGAVVALASRQTRLVLLSDIP
jgi:hypothetical protein